MDICCRPSVPRGLGKERVEASYSCISLDRLEGAESLSEHSCSCLLYTSDAADDWLVV